MEGEGIVAPAYLTADEVAGLLRVSPKTVYRLASADASLPVLRLGGTVRFPRERLLRWLWDREQGRPRIRKPMLSARNSAESRGVATGG